MIDTQEAVWMMHAYFWVLLLFLDDYIVGLLVPSLLITLYVGSVGI